MRTLIIIRHAKSDWENFSDDFHRQLAHRGISDAALVATHASQHLPGDFLIWSSSAKRASHTAVIFAREFGYRLEDIDFKDELYTFDSRELEKIIKSCNDTNDSLIVFGHNEAITDFVNKFGDILIDNVPTSGFVMITFDTDLWTNIGKGKTRKVIFPRDLKS